MFPIGNSGSNWLIGNAGDDTISGGPGEDKLYGMAGADEFYAQDGYRDEIAGGSDSDTDVVISYDDGVDVLMDIP